MRLKATDSSRFNKPHLAIPSDQVPRTASNYKQQQQTGHPKSVNKIAATWKTAAEHHQQQNSNSEHLTNSCRLHEWRYKAGQPVHMPGCQTDRLRLPH
jgi:hypothetical protein